MFLMEQTLSFCTSLHLYFHKQKVSAAGQDKCGIVARYYMTTLSKSINRKTNSTYPRWRSAKYCYTGVCKAYPPKLYYHCQVMLAISCPTRIERSSNALDIPYFVLLQSAVLWPLWRSGIIKLKWSFFDHSCTQGKWGINSRNRISLQRNMKEVE